MFEYFYKLIHSFPIENFEKDFAAIFNDFVTKDIKFLEFYIKFISEEDNLNMK